MLRDLIAEDNKHAAQHFPALIEVRKILHKRPYDRIVILFESPVIGVRFLFESLICLLIKLSEGFQISVFSHRLFSFVDLDSLIIVKSRFHVCLRKIRPEHIREPDLRIDRLPREKV